MPVATIVIPLFNRCDLTVRCLQALEANTPPERYEVVIVDNASTDETESLLASLEGDVTTLRNATNLGFARACNQGAAAAGGEVIVFLNNDTEVQPGWLDALLGVLDREPGVGAVGARLLFPNGGVQHAGVLLVERTDLGLLDPQHRTTEELSAWEPQAVTGAVMAVRSSAFSELGGFDEGFWNCYEDIDLCLRLGAAGWRIAYVPAAVVVHHEGASGPERTRGIPEGTRRFSERWLGKVVPDVVHDGRSANPAPLTVRSDNPEPGLVAALWDVTRRSARQLGAPVRLDGRRADALRERLQQEEERRLLLLARDGRDVCWEDEGEAEPLVTIRIPTFDRGPLLAERAIASALGQTYDRIEVLVVGDAADEATERAATSTGDPRVRFVNLPRRGVYPPRGLPRWQVAGVEPVNVALALAAGSWIAPCDDDDELTPDHVEVLLAHARRERAEMVWSKATMEAAPGTWRECGEPRLREGGIAHGTVLYAAPLRFLRYSTTCWKQDQPADWNLWSRMQAIGVRMSFLDHVTYIHHQERLRV